MSGSRRSTRGSPPARAGREDPLRARCRPSRSPGPTWTASPRSTARCTRSCTSPRMPRWRRPRSSTTSLAAGTAPASPLAGVPLALKDVFTTIDMPTTAGSRILEGWRPPYDATVAARLRAAGHHDPGQDQHGRVRHGLLHRALGLRHHAQPVGPRPRARRLRRRLGGGAGRVRGAAGHRHRHRRLDPPARRVHRHGRGQAHLRRRLALRADRLRVVARPGRPVRPHRARRRAAARGDRRATTRSTPPRSTRPSRPSSRRRRAGARGDLVRACASASSASWAARATSRACGRRSSRPCAQLEKLGAEVVEVSCPHFEYGLAAYYLILPSEVSSNLARFDAMRYGLRVRRRPRSAEEVMAATREAGFGAEVKRRIMLGTYALSSGYYDAYYGQAQKVRTLISRDFAAAFEPGRRAGLARPRRPRRSRSATRSTTRWPCTSTTSPRSRPTSRAPRRCRCRPAWPPTTACPSACRSWRPRSPRPCMYRVAAAYEAPASPDAVPRSRSDRRCSP